jgi:hypothetical protein
MKNSLVLRSLSLALLAASTLVACGARAQNAARVARQGHDEGNAGDGVYVDGKLVMRDFLTNADLVLDNKAFLNKYPELVSLLREIGNTNPQLTLAVWNDLTKVRIFTTTAALPLLPKDQTGLDFEQVADVQIAIRDGDDLLISLSDLNQLPEKEYLFLHEAFHGLIKGSGPLHHIKIRSLTKYFKENRGHYVGSSVEQVLSKAGLSLYPFYSMSSYGDQISASIDMNKIYRTLVSGEGSTRSRCALKAVVFTDSLLRIWASYDLGALSNWLDYPNCQSDKVDFDAFAREYPGIANAWGKELPFTYEVNVVNKHWSRDIELEQCNQYANPSVLNEIEEFENLVLDAQRDLQKLSDLEVRKGDDEAQLMAFKIIGLRGLMPNGSIFSRGLTLNGIDSTLLDIKKAKNTYNTSVKNCQSAYDYKKGRWVR